MIRPDWLYTYPATMPYFGQWPSTWWEPRADGLPLWAMLLVGVIVVQSIAMFLYVYKFHCFLRLCTASAEEPAQQAASAATSEG